MEKTDEREMSGALFVNLVSSLYSSAMLCLGKVMNPSTGKIEKNLEGARTNIEILRMLKEKTAGNLTDEESRIMGDALSNMQMNYVDELERPEKEKAAAGKDEKAEKEEEVKQGSEEPEKKDEE